MPGRTRVTHAGSLIQRFEEAWADAAERQVVAQSDRNGIYLEFVSTPGYDLRTKSLENRQQGIRLLNVRTRVEGDEQVQLATVYVPKAKSSYFLKKIEQFRDEDTEISGEPKNKPLVASIEDVRAALVRAFWTDPPDELPGANKKWVEVWLGTDDITDVDEFRESLAEAGIQESEHKWTLHFPERTVLLVKANLAELGNLLDKTDHLAELRKGRETATFFLDLANEEQANWVQDLLGRLAIDENSKVSINILDSGVNRGHPLLEPLLAEADVQAVDDDWGTADHTGHGTLMAGVAAYGDLVKELQSTEPILVRHCLESNTIVPPAPGQNPPELWGAVTAQGVYRAEISASHRRRVTCLAWTATSSRDRGKPTSWSAEIDGLAAGAADDKRRLIIISAGNTSDPADWSNYPDGTLTNEVHDPAQAWNAVTVGAYTEKVLINDPGLEGYQPVSPAGGLSPFSTTSRNWPQNKWPVKPDVMFEGGNVAKHGDGNALTTDSLAPMSTSRNTTVSHFAHFPATSAASAQAAHFAAMLLAEYPDAWPETVRGLMVHSAEWTAKMVEQFKHGAGKGAYQVLLRTCGFGVPNLSRALHCMASRLTLVTESELVPYKKVGSDYKTNELHVHTLPWPQDVLQELGGVKVRMRVTLSYFIEPGPGEKGWANKYRYPSHGLRFELNAPAEDLATFTKRINAQARDEDEGHPGSDSPADHWLLGSQQRDVGSIHSDIWEGTAADLAASNMIAIRPTIGWWRERHHLGRYDRTARYSLVVSIHSPSEDVDVYTPVANLIGIPIEIVTDL